MKTGNIINIFIAYSRDDARLCEELNEQLSPLKRSEQINIWYDDNIRPGEDWNDEIKTALENSDIILLLTSNHFLNSQFCMHFEVREAMEQHRKKKTLVIPIILSHCNWKITEFGQLQALPKDLTPIYEGNEVCNIDRAMKEVVIGIWEVVVRLVKEINVPKNETIDTENDRHRKCKTTHLDVNSDFKKKWNGIQRTAWNKIQDVINKNPDLLEEPEKCISVMINEVKKTISQNLIIRLWGSCANLPDYQNTFENVSQTVGKCCLENEYPIIVHGASKYTFEYYALSEIVKIINENKKSNANRTVKVYNHFLDYHYTEIKKELNIKRIPRQLNITDIEYPTYINSAERSAACSSPQYHDARMGSLLQSNVIFLLGGRRKKSTIDEMLELLFKIRDGMLRCTSLPPIVIPLPWAGGRAQEIFNDYNNSLEL